VLIEKARVLILVNFLILRYKDILQIYVSPMTNYFTFLNLFFKK